jgi:hypothetical protein
MPEDAPDPPMTLNARGVPCLDGTRRARGHRMPWPDWWDWALERTPHLEKRMDDRACTEVDLRAM